jgi:hypothetical protein
VAYYPLAVVLPYNFMLTFINSDLWSLKKKRKCYELESDWGWLWPDGHNVFENCLGNVGIFSLLSYDGGV